MSPADPPPRLMLAGIRLHREVLRLRSSLGRLARELDRLERSGLLLVAAARRNFERVHGSRGGVLDHRLRELAGVARRGRPRR